MSDQIIVELRSDTFTKPSMRMFKAMSTADIGDAQYFEDNTVNKLQDRVAEIFGKEASIFMPSGTMANLTAVMAHCYERGSECIIGNISHFQLWEQGGISQIAGVYPKQIATLEDGTFDLETVKDSINALDNGCPITRLICIENTHNWTGGRILPLEFISNLYDICKKNDIRLHMDGSRVMNAAYASNIDVKIICKDVDSINFCFSKGVGAPIGSILIGTNDLIKKAFRIRQVLGGAMRQTGVLAAACLVGLDEMHIHIPKDNENAKKLVEGISKNTYGVVSVDVKNVQTNIVHVKILKKNLTPEQFQARLAKVTDDEFAELKQSVCVKAGIIDKTTMRLLTHWNVNSEQIDLAIKKIHLVLAEYARSIEE